ncbi:hypothetical protein [Actinomadura sp. WMMA1423]|uniref:hypothetical protein n=1 Tax=Actinomadura sp. WMMA1423 TaxID=2591108 RepID=UPI0011475335|nr:hypothetical protein [Actinomadura sp. WMMA1423]
MRLTDRVEQVVMAVIEGHAALAGCEVDHQVQIIHQQTPGAQPTPMLWISLSVRSLALGEWLFYDPIISADLHPEPAQLTQLVRRALAALAAARNQQAQDHVPSFTGASRMTRLPEARPARLPAPARPLTTGP